MLPLPPRSFAQNFCRSSAAAGVPKVVSPSLPLSLRYCVRVCCCYFVSVSFWFNFVWIRGIMILWECILIWCGFWLDILSEEYKSWSGWYNYGVCWAPPQHFIWNFSMSFWRKIWIYGDYFDVFAVIFCDPGVKLSLFVLNSFNIRYFTNYPSLQNLSHYILLMLNHTTK